jgi:hypothetical protein
MMKEKIRKNNLDGMLLPVLVSDGVYRHIHIAEEDSSTLHLTE